MMDEVQRVYVVDDDRDLGASVARLLRRSGYQAEPFLDPVMLLDVYAAAPADCIVTDVMMGDLDGFAFADRIRALDAASALVFMTAWPTTANAVDSVRRYGGLDYLEKPLDEDRLLAAVREGVQWSHQRRRQIARTATLTRGRGGRRGIDPPATTHDRPDRAARGGAPRGIGPIILSWLSDRGGLAATRDRISTRDSASS